MIVQHTINQSYSCLDNNPKVVKRVYDWNGKLVQFKLCKNHLQDQDFSNFIDEETL